MSVYLVGVHLVLAGLALASLRAAPLLFVLAEVLILASLAAGFRLVNRALQPLDYTQRFRDLLQDKDYSARMGDSKMPELDELLDLFNTMLSALYNERLELGEQRGFLDSLLEATPSAVIVLDFDERITLLNASAQALLGLDDARGRRLGDCVVQDADPRGPSLLALLDALPLGHSRLLADPGGRRYRAQRGSFFDRGFARHFLLVEELTVELEDSERSTYEKLIRVLAHEVNNTVAATGSVLDSVLYYSAQLAEKDRADFTTAIVAARRRNASLGDFIERFTRVIRMPEPELRPASVADIMDDILWLNRDQCKSRGISIGWERREAVPAQRMDGQLVEQALINIVKNAIEAVDASQSEQGPGKGAVKFSLVSEDGGARLSISDSGNRLGAVPDRRLFTPFFSTKKGGQGIGLMFVREVLNRHGFRYRLATDGDETRFDIWFPAAA